MGPPPQAPRAPPSTPISPRASNTNTSQDFSYFSPHVPASVPTSPYPQLSATLPHPADSSRPIIQGFVTTMRNPQPGQQAMHSQPLQYGQQPYHRLNPHHHTHPPPPPSDVLQQFALHIPAPPQLTMPAKLGSRHPSSSGSSSASSSATPTPPATASGSGSRINNGTGMGMSSGHTFGAPAPLASTQASQQHQQAPEMSCRSETTQHALSVRLPKAIASEMVTISANKGDRLRVVAQAWRAEDESHYEWSISFPPFDVDLSKVQAKFDPDGCLTIRVPRRPKMMGR